MFLYEHFSAVFLISTGPVNVRRLPPDEEITPATQADMPAMVGIAEVTRGRGARTPEMFMDRFSKGMTAYILRKEGKPASYLWLTKEKYPLYDLRLFVETPQGAATVFGENTPPWYRRQGMLGKLLRFAWDAHSLHMMAICVAADNQVSLAANCRLGFRPACTISMTQLLAMRLHVIRQPKGGAAHQFLSRPRLGVNPFMLRCRLDSGGLRDVGWTRADMLNAQTNPFFHLSHGTCHGRKTFDPSGTSRESPISASPELPSGSRMCRRGQ